MKTVQINAVKKDASGKKAAKQSRREGYIPAIIYGGEEPTQINLKLNDVKGVVYTSEFILIDMKVDDGSTHRCFLKSVQLHPVTDEIQHLDFLRLMDGHPVIVQIPVEFTGNAIGIKNGGIFLQQMRKIKIKSLPENLIASLSVDITELNLGQTVKIRDLDITEGVQIMHDPTIPIASVEVPRSLKSAEADLGEGEEGEEDETTEETTEETSEE